MSKCAALWDAYKEVLNTERVKLKKIDKDVQLVYELEDNLELSTKMFGATTDNTLTGSKIGMDDNDIQIS